MGIKKSGDEMILPYCLLMVALFDFFKLDFTPCKVELRLRHIELQEREEKQRWKGYRKVD